VPQKSYETVKGDEKQADEIVPLPVSLSYSDRLKNTLAEKQAELDKLTKSNAALKTDLAAAEKTEKDVEQTVNSYQQAWQNLDKSKKEADAYVKRKLPVVEQTIGKAKDAIDKVISKDDDDTKNLIDKVASLDVATKSADTKYREAVDKLAAAQSSDPASFDNTKAYPSAQAANLKSAQELIARTEKENLARPASMYFLVTEVQKIVQATDLESVDEFRQKMSKALGNLAGAITAVRDAKKDLENNKVDLDNSQKALADSQGKRRERILKAISSFDEGGAATTA
jgi:hypothetical protein